MQSRDHSKRAVVRGGMVYPSVPVSFHDHEWSVVPIDEISTRCANELLR